MDDSSRRLSEAEKQIQRLEALRRAREEESRRSAEKAFDRRTFVEGTVEKLRQMKADSRAPRRGRWPRIEGKRKSVKVTLLQARAMEQIAERAPELSGSALVRMALDRMLGIEPSAEGVKLEQRFEEILKDLRRK